MNRPNQELPPIVTDIPAGTYRHFKGNRYQVLGIARHSETLEEMVVYRPLYGQGGLWARPAAMFLEMVETETGKQPRFVLEDAPSQPADT